jgi:hypothetical protein
VQTKKKRKMKHELSHGSGVWDDQVVFDKKKKIDDKMREAKNLNRRKQ